MNLIDKKDDFAIKLDKNLISAIKSIFPVMLMNLDEELTKLFKESTKDLSNNSIFLDEIREILKKTFDYQAEKFKRFHYEPMKFLIFFQQRQEDIRSYVEKDKKARELVANFFKILGKRRKQKHAPKK